MHKLILYIINLFIVIWACDGINLNGMFKKNKFYQAKIMYIIIIFGLTYLLTNFMLDFVGCMK